MKYIIGSIIAIIILSATTWQAIRITGNMEGDGTAANPLGVAADGITAREIDVSGVDDGTYTAAIITVDEDGRITSAENGPRVVSESFPAESKTNSTTSDQDFTSIYSIPGGTLVEGKIYEVVLAFTVTSGTSTALWSPYIKLGGTKAMTPNAGVNVTNGVTQYVSLTFNIHGTAAASASSPVRVYNGGYMYLFGAVNATGPQNHDTTGDLDIVPGITFNATGSTETWTLDATQVREITFP